MDSILKYKPVVEQIVGYVMSRHPLNGAVQKDDLIQEGLITLWECLDSYDNTKNVPFELYMRNMVKWKVSFYITKMYKGNLPLKPEIYLENNSYENKIELESDINYICGEVRKDKLISEKHKNIFLHYVCYRNMKEVANIFNTNQSTVTYIVKKVRKQLKEKLEGESNGDNKQSI